MKRKYHSRFFISGHTYPKSKLMSPGDLENLVAMYRSGDDTVKEMILEQHYSLVMHIASQYAFKFQHLADDILSVAMEYLVEAVSRAPQTLKDNQITPYIDTYVRGSILKYIGQSCIVSTPFNHRFEDHYEPITCRVISGYIDDDGEWNGDEVGVNVETATPANDLTVDFLIDETIKVLNLNSKQAKLLVLRSEGYTMQEIGDYLGKSKQHISMLVAGIQVKARERL